MRGISMVYLGKYYYMYNVFVEGFEENIFFVGLLFCLIKGS